MRTTKRTELAWGVLCALTGVLPACGADATRSSEDPNAGPDDVGVVHEAVWESTCWTQATANATINVIPTQGGYSASSHNATYGQPSCPNQFIVDVNNVAGVSFQIDGEPSAQSGSNSDWCPGFWGATRAMGWRPGVGWQQIDSYQEQGYYTGGFFFFPYCTESVTSGSYPAIHPANHPYTKVRIVTQGGWTLSYQPVTVLFETF